MAQLVGRWIDDGLVECGLDEAGRGCLAGAVFAAAVILPEDFRHPLLNDSKQLTERQRYTLRPIIEAEAIAWGLGYCTAEEIDQMNILRASHLAMHRALEQLIITPERLLVDGNRFTPYEGIAHECIIKGDALVKSIAAASILAKTYRDDSMMVLHEQFPEYRFDSHKGYPTPEHRRAIRKYGVSPVHRKSFRLF
ncbi:MAG: ribonuclease HII [Porphyromonas sp.]|nr:ribonuclease HII [Porphyromonas sp.]